MSTKSNQTIAERMIKLNEVVAWFDSDDFELEQALDKFKEAEKIAGEIERDLVAMKNDIEVVKARFKEA